MKYYFFRKPIVRYDNTFKDDFGTFEDEFFTSSADLISHANNGLEECGYKRLSKKEIGSITSADMPNFDFYAVQGWCDGFGNDTYTATICKTYDEAKAYIAKYWGNGGREPAIVGQYFGKAYINKWE